MTTQDNTSPAFPQSHSPEYPREIVGGITMRDYFAAKAINQMLSLYTDSLGHCDLGQLCRASYKLADEMLEARK